MDLESGPPHPCGVTSSACTFLEDKQKVRDDSAAFDICQGLYLLFTFFTFNHLAVIKGFYCGDSPKSLRMKLHSQRTADKIN